MDDISLTGAGFWLPVGGENLTFAAMSHPTLRSLASYPICAMVSLMHVNVARIWIWLLTFIKCWG